jgi:hypothetical protein
VSSNASLLIYDEIKNVDEMFSKYELLFTLAKQKEPDSVELLALASLVHSFYNGLENIFQIISKRIDSYMPSSSNWHTDLLTRMGIATEMRSAVLHESTLSSLHEYLGFRHFFRHSYTYTIEWVKLQPLVENNHNTWSTVKVDLELFCSTCRMDK